MKNALVTIIIPVYNVERFLEKCLASVINQSYKNLEIILVDDGSKDNSGKICDEYAQLDKRIIVVHQKNGGLSAARNAGLDIMHGQYVMFVDSDDYIDLDMVKDLCSDIEKYNAGIAECVISNVYSDELQIVNKQVTEKKFYSTEEALIADLGAVGGAVSACAKLYVSEIFDTYRFKVGRLHEDHYAIVDLLGNGRSVVFNPKPMYFYVHRNDSITTERFNDRSLDDVDAALRNYEIVREQYPKAFKAAEFRVDMSVARIIDKIMFFEDWQTNEHLKKLEKHLRENCWRIINNPYFTIKRKMGIIVFIVSKRLYRKVMLKSSAKQFVG